MFPLYTTYSSIQFNSIPLIRSDNGANARNAGFNFFTIANLTHLKGNDLTFITSINNRGRAKNLYSSFALT